MMMREVESGSRDNWTKYLGHRFGAQQLSVQPPALLLEEISATILDSLGHGYPHLYQVAKKVGIKQRTLQRRLAAAGTSYTQLVSELRFELAAKLLEDPAVPIASVAKQAGFGNHSGFTRAFRAWTGTTPRQHRAQLLSRDDRDGG